MQSFFQVFWGKYKSQATRQTSEENPSQVITLHFASHLQVSEKDPWNIHNFLFLDAVRLQEQQYQSISQSTRFQTQSSTARV